MGKVSTSCPFCHGEGIYADHWDYDGRRRVMDSTGKGPKFTNVRRYACDRCGMPKGLKVAAPARHQ